MKTVLWPFLKISTNQRSCLCGGGWNGLFEWYREGSNKYCVLLWMYYGWNVENGKNTDDDDDDEENIWSMAICFFFEFSIHFASPFRPEDFSKLMKWAMGNETSRAIYLINIHRGIAKNSNKPKKTHTYKLGRRRWSANCSVVIATRIFLMPTILFSFGETHTISHFDICA